MASTPFFENPSFALLHKLFKQFYLAITTFVTFTVQVTLLWNFFKIMRFARLSCHANFKQWGKWKAYLCPLGFWNINSWTRGAFLTTIPIRCSNGAVNHRVWNIQRVKIELEFLKELFQSIELIIWKFHVKCSPWFN